jgi:hypothetical protein
MKNSIAIVFIFLAAFACKDVQKEVMVDANQPEKQFIDSIPGKTTAQLITSKNGLDTWDDVSEINFTFNVDRGERHFERSFIWRPKSGDVVYMTSSDTISFNRNFKMDSLQILADRAFINDKYWFLAPYHLVWDQGKTISEKESQLAPISKDTLDMITITYGEEGGYTPGDAYDLYFGKDLFIKEWAFREGNDSVPTMTTTWEDYKDFNGLNIATMHRDSTGNFKLYFTNISVKK